jgi:DNA polymerase-1
MVIVTPENLDCCVERISHAGTLAVDCETTGLYPYQNDELFSVAIGISGEQFYFDVRLLSKEQITPILHECFRSSKTIYMHNAKFDMAFIWKYAGVEFDATIYDTMVLARLYKNNALSLSLDDVASWFGQAKDKTVEAYVKKHKCVYFDVPMDLISFYACEDVRITLTIGIQLFEELDKLNALLVGSKKNIYDVVALEADVTKVLFHMEREGVLIDRKYTEDALRAQTKTYQEAKARVESIIGEDFVDSGKALERYFRGSGNEERFVRTEKNNFSFTDSVLSGFDGELAKGILEIRKAYKKAKTYYSAFLELADSKDRIHTNFRQAGTSTGRLSAAQPNLQNLHAEEEEGADQVRGCFVCPTDYSWLSIDYKAAEFRLLLDYAKERQLAGEIIKGHDPHQATADMMNTSRKYAKTLNFMLLYGGGSKKLADTLGVSLEEGRVLKSKYFNALPGVERLIKFSSQKAEKEGYVHNYLGMVYRFDKEYAYKSLNAIIQGGCAHIMKTALVNLHEFLLNHKTKLVLTIHDEVCFYLHKDEFHIVEDLKRIMRESYMASIMPQDVSASISDLRWSELVDI